MKPLDGRPGAASLLPLLLCSHASVASTRALFKGRVGDAVGDAVGTGEVVAFCSSMVSCPVCCCCALPAAAAARVALGRSEKRRSGEVRLSEDADKGEVTGTGTAGPGGEGLNGDITAAAVVDTSAAAAAATGASEASVSVADRVGVCGPRVSLLVGVGRLCARRMDLNGLALGAGDGGTNEAGV